MAKGWRNESRRHSLAAKGIKTAVNGKPLVWDGKTDSDSRYFKLRQDGLSHDEAVKQLTNINKVPVNITETVSTYDIKKANERAGKYWFTPDSMKFFNSNIESIGYLKKGSSTEGYFISSEKHTNSYMGISEPRKYTIRKFDLKTGGVDTEGDFQAYNSKSEAILSMKKLLGVKKIPSKRPFRWERSQQYRNAKQEDIDKFVGLKSKKYEGRSFTIDEKDARLIVANLKKEEYDDFKNKFKNGTVSEFRLLQDYAGEHSKIR